MADSKIAFVFPGQGSQKVGMGADLSQTYPTARKMFEEADNILHFPISKIIWEGPAELLNDTINTQPALLIQSSAVLFVL
ncbi:MAG: acyltransferase domain-containing protein, partial [Anaerolineaceae bacterium]